MELYDVTVWDASGGDEPDDWTIESPSVRVEAGDSYEAARKVAGRAGIRLGLSSGIKRPRGETGMFFEASEEELIFQVEDTSSRKPLRGPW